MKKLFLFIFILALPTGVFATIQPGQPGTSAATRWASFATASTTSLNSPSVSGNQIDCVVSMSIEWTTASVPYTPTWGGLPMRLLIATSTPAGYSTSIFHLPNCPQGVSTVVINSGSNWTTGFGLVSWLTGVDQNQSIDSVASTSGAVATSFSDTITTNQNSEFVIDSVINQSQPTIAVATAPAIKMTQGSTGNSPTMVFLAGSLLTGAQGAQTISWTGGTSARWIGTSVSFRPAVYHSFVFASGFKYLFNSNYQFIFQ